MKKEHLNLWLRIATFKLDDPKADRPFSTKLAEEQKWTTDFTQRVIAEYKKFVFLCVTLPNGATPSSIIDEAWHLHLTYTDSYWNQFCNNALGTQLHHNPSKGGSDEGQKHDNWYRQTLIAYIETFGHIPPDDIWAIPFDFDVVQYLPKNSPFLMQNMGNTEGVSEDSFFEKNLGLQQITYGLIAFLTIAVLYPPLLKDVIFLIPYVALGIVIAALIAQYNAEHKAIIDKRLQDLSDISPYYGAWIAGGNERLITTFLYETTTDCQFQTKANTITLQLKNDDTLHKNPLFASLQTVEKSEVSIAFIKESVRPYWQLIRYQIEQKSYKAASLPTKIGLFLTTFGVIGFIRMMEGVFFHKNIVFLVFALFMFIIILVIVYKVTTVSFNDWRDSFTDHYKAQYTTANNDMMWQFALGTAIFSVNTNWYGIENDLKPKQQTTNSWGGGGDSSSCSSGGDGGGSSCGGGCGGCGGGD